jgi:hypothetical protein
MWNFVDNLHKMCHFLFKCCYETKLGKQKSEENILKIQALSKKHNISILPIMNSYEIQSLYPETSQAHTWSTFIIGKDKTYALTNKYDFNIESSYNKLFKRTTNGQLHDDLLEFFDPIWERTLNGQQLQFFMIYCSIIYFVNTFALRNDSYKVIGASMFIRSLDTMPTISSRASFEQRSRIYDSPFKRLSLDDTNKFSNTVFKRLSFDMNNE